MEDGTSHLNEHLIRDFQISSKYVGSNIEREGFPTYVLCHISVCNTHYNIVTYVIK